MKKLLLLTCVVFVSLVVVEGCAKRVIVTAPRPVSISDSELLALPETRSLDSIAVELDTLPIVTEVELCSNFGMKTMGDLGELSRIAESMLIDVFSSRNIEVRDSADKRLTISISKAYCESGAWVWQMVTVLRVRTGSGVTLEFEGSRRLGNLHQASWAVELAVKSAVIEMLESPEINKYISANEGSGQG